MTGRNSPAHTPASDPHARRPVSRQGPDTARPGAYNGSRANSRGGDPSPTGTAPGYPDPAARTARRTTSHAPGPNGRTSPGRAAWHHPTGTTPGRPSRQAPRRHFRGARRGLRSFLLTFLLTMAVVLPCALGIGFYLKGRLPAISPGPASSSRSTGASLSSSPAADSATPAPLTVDLSGLNSREAILLQRGGGILGEQNAAESIYPASLTKMMTVLLAAENLTDLDAAVTLEDDLFGPLWSANASMAGFEPGETVTVRDFLYGALLPSGAECCAAIAVQLDSSETAFADRMNRRAEALGMENTHFVNATGLQDSEHVSTVGDLAVLLDAALDNPTFREVFTAPRYSTRPTNLHPDGITVYSSAVSLLQDADLGRMTLLGGKTGFTDEAGLCLATLLESDGTEYILVTAGAPGQSHTDTAHARDAATVCQRLSDALNG